MPLLLGPLVAILGVMVAVYVTRTRARARRSLYSTMRTERQRQAREIHGRMVARAVVLEVGSAPAPTLPQVAVTPPPPPKVEPPPSPTEKRGRVAATPPSRELKPVPVRESPARPRRVWWRRRRPMSQALPPQQAPPAPMPPPPPAAWELPATAPLSPPPSPKPRPQERVSAWELPLPPPPAAPEPIPAAAAPAEGTVEVAEAEARPSMMHEVLSYLSLAAAVVLVVGGVFLMLAVSHG